MIRILLLLAAFTFRADFSICQQPEFDKGTKDLHSAWTVTASKTKGIAKGDVITLTITGKPDKGWNLYSSNAEGEIAFNPTSLSLNEELNKGVELVGGLKDVVAPHEEKDEIMGGILRHYEAGEEVSFTQEIKITANSFSLESYFNGQICLSDGMCVLLNAQIHWSGKTGE